MEAHGRTWKVMLRTDMAPTLLNSVTIGLAARALWSRWENCHTVEAAGILSYRLWLSRIKLNLTEPKWK